MTERASVVIAVATYRRPVYLDALLDAIARLEVTATVSVVVCDNDAIDAAGTDVVARRVADGGFPFPLHSIAEPTRGISYARNRLFDLICANMPCTYIALIDDDERPSPQWLSHLLSVAEQTGADIVGGPVASEFLDPDVQHSIRNCAQFRPKQRPTGPVDVVLSTENVLVRRAALDLVARPWFDPAFAITGGEDADFFYRLRRAGATFAWAADALVTELVPPERSTDTWVVGRSFRRGCNTAWRALRRPGRWFYVPRLVVLGAGAILSFPVVWLATAGRPAQRLNARARFWRALGYLSGFAQIRVRDYDEVHGK